jgi:hypothetical protein
VIVAPKMTSPAGAKRCVLEGLGLVLLRRPGEVALGEPVPEQEVRDEPAQEELLVQVEALVLDDLLLGGFFRLLEALDARDREILHRRRLPEGVAAGLLER